MQTEDIKTAVIKAAKDKGYNLRFERHDAPINPGGMVAIKSNERCTIYLGVNYNNVPINIVAGTIAFGTNSVLIGDSIYAAANEADILKISTTIIDNIKTIKIPK